jgi:hypothetical protein
MELRSGFKYINAFIDPVEVELLKPREPVLHS